MPRANYLSAGRHPGEKMAGCCRICGNKTMNRPYEIREMMFGLRETFAYFQCSNCQCLQISKIPEDMSKYYTSHYYSFSRGRKKLQIAKLKKSVKKLNNKYAVFGDGIIGKLLYTAFPEPSMRCLSRIPINKSMRILEVGSGDGGFLLDLAEIGFTNLVGIDPYIEEDISFNKKVSVFKQSIEDVSGKWDIIIFHHSFEHCEDPETVLMHVSHLLDFHGTCIIRVPTVSSFAWEHYHTDWVQIDAPRHFFIPSIRSMELLAEKANLQLIDVQYDSTAFQFWGSEQYRRKVSLFSDSSYLVNPRKSIFRYADIFLFKKRAKRLNLLKHGDQLALYLKKL